MRHLIFKKLPKGKGKKNLFKFGANQMPKSESLMEAISKKSLKWRIWIWKGPLNLASP
jgi:hypothetical protein